MHDEERGRAAPVAGLLQCGAAQERLGLAAPLPGPVPAPDVPVAYESFKPKVVYWAAAYSEGGKPEAAMIDVEGTEKLIPVIIERCKAAPKDSFYQKVKAEAKKK